VKIELRKLSEIKPYPNNPRQNDSTVDAVAASIREFGFRQPIVVDGDGVIIVGHTRYKAALKLGLEKVPVHVVKDLTPEQIKAYRIADNQTASLATWDYDLLSVELATLKEEDFDLQLLGFNSDMLELLLEKDKEETAAEQTNRGLQSLWQVIIECADESDQRKLYERLTAEGYRCRTLIL